MYFFLLIIIPLVYCVSEFICRGRKPERERIAGVFFGVVLACIYALIHFFAIGSFRVWTYSLSAVWLHYFFTEIAIPVVICLTAVFIGKDSFRIKLSNLFPVVASFYVVFLPYKLITETIAPDVFCMILYPLLIASMLFNIDTVTFVFEDGAELEKRLWLRCVISFFAIVPGLLLPPLFRSLYCLKSTGTATYILAVLYVLFSAGLRTLAMLFLTEKTV